MVTDNISQKASERVWQLTTAALFALGGIWLQNQFNMMTALQAQVIDIRKEQNQTVKDMDQRYVPMHTLNRIWSDNNARMTAIESKIDRLLLEFNHKDGPNRAAPH